MPQWTHRTALAAVAAVSAQALVSCASGPAEPSEQTTVTASSTFDACSDLTSEFIEEYDLRLPGEYSTQNDIQMCKYDRTVAQYSWVYIGLYDPSRVKPNEAGIPPGRPITISGHPASRIGGQERHEPTGNSTCSIKVHLDRDDLVILYSSGLLPRPDDDYACRHAIELTEDLIQLIEATK